MIKAPASSHENTSSDLPFSLPTHRCSLTRSNRRREADEADGVYLLLYKQPIHVMVDTATLKIHFARKQASSAGPWSLPEGRQPAVRILLSLSVSISLPDDLRR